MDTYTLLVFLHVVLFAYWLGADLGVHLAARFAIRSDLPFEERMRFLVLILLIDLGPETAIILMVPLGLTLAVMSGIATVAPGLLTAIWLVAIVWLAAIWKQHLDDILRPGEPAPLKPLLHGIDNWVRNIAMLGAFGMAASSWLGHGPLSTDWLAMKSLLYGVALGLVGLLRHELSSWGVAIEKLQTPATVDEANAIIMATHKKGRWYAWSLWLVVALAAYFGVAKPI